MKWLSGRFPPSHPAKTVNKSTTSCVMQRKEQKAEIMQKLAQQRRKAQERRKQLYAEDNEELFNENEDEEEEEEADDEQEMEEECDDLEDSNAMGAENSDGDDDGGEEENGGVVEDNCDDAEENNDEDEHEEKEEPEEKPADEIGVLSYGGLEGEKEPAHNGSTSLPLPNTLSQWFNRSDDKLHETLTADKDMFDDFIKTNDLVGKKANSQSELLDLCSGNFATQHAGQSFVEEESDEDDVRLRKRKETCSDDEENGNTEESNKGQNVAVDEENEDETQEQPGEHRKIFNRVVIESDEDSEEDLDELDEYPEDIDEVEEYPDEVDSDDEMAMFRKQEKARETRRDWVEEEAELSGDDVGSDGEDEDHNDHYEAEAGDEDEVPDDEDLRTDLHKQLMKQQESSDHRELVQLRERLLGDDITGVETNRTFRLKLREDGVDNVDEEDKKEDEEEADDEINIESIKRRMEMEKEMDLNGDDEIGTDVTAVDVFSTITRSTTLTTTKLGGRVRASLLHIDSSKMLGKEQETGKETKNNFFISNDDENEKEKTISTKRKSTTDNEISIVKKYRPSNLAYSNVFSKFN